MAGYIDWLNGDDRMDEVFNMIHPQERVLDEQTLRPKPATQRTPKSSNKQKGTQNMNKNMGAFSNNNYMSKMMDRMFRRVENVVWDMMTGSVGVKNKDDSILTRGELITSEDGSVDFDITENMFDSFAMPIPAFAQSTPRDQVKPGDMIMMTSGQVGWVVAVKERSFSIKKVDGSTTQWSPPKVSTMGMVSDGIMVVRSLLDMSGGTTGMSNMMASLMPLMMMTDDPNSDSRLEKMIPMMLMMNANGNAGGMSSMLPMMMLMGGGNNFFG